MALNPQINLGTTEIFKILVPPFQEHGKHLHLHKCCSVSQHSVTVFLIQVPHVSYAHPLSPSHCDFLMRQGSCTVHTSAYRHCLCNHPRQAPLVPKPLFTAWSPLGAPRPMTPEGRQHFPGGCRPLLLNSSAVHSLHTIHVLSHWTRPVLQARRFLQMEPPLPMLPACRNESHSCRAIQMLLHNPHS